MASTNHSAPILMKCNTRRFIHIKAADTIAKRRRILDPRTEEERGRGRYRERDR